MDEVHTDSATFIRGNFVPQVRAIVAYLVRLQSSRIGRKSRVAFEESRECLLKRVESVFQREPSVVIEECIIGDKGRSRL